AVRVGGASSLVVVPTDHPGIARLPLDAISGEKLFEVTFDHLEIRPDDLPGAVADGAALLTSALRAGSLARTAEMVGGAQRVLELVIEHAKTRVQGGRPIGGYQAIQHACADLVRDVDAARGLLYAAAWRAAEGRPAESDAAQAKAYAGEACLAVARRGHQIFGAISYCEEHPLHLIHKRIQAASVEFGDGQFHLETVARAIGLVSQRLPPPWSSPCGAWSLQTLHRFVARASHDLSTIVSEARCGTETSTARSASDHSLVPPRHA